MSTILIPAELVPLLRTALMSEIGNPADAISEASMAPKRTRHPERFMRPLRELDEYRAALDAVGWSDPEQEQPVQLDLDQYRDAIGEALRTWLEIEQEYMEEEARHKDDAGYAKAARKAQLIAEFIATNGLTEDS